MTAEEFRALVYAYLARDDDRDAMDRRYRNLAAACEVSCRTVHGWATGQYVPHPAVREHVARVLDGAAP